MNSIKSKLCALAVAALCAASLYAFDPPPGGDSLLSLGSPQALGSYPSVASVDSPSADLANPAASGGLQRSTFEANYIALMGLGSEAGWGHAINLGLAIPRPYGVWTGRLGFVGSPFDSMPLGNVVRARVGMAKDLYPKLYAGAAVDFAVGANDGLGWGLDADLGVLGFAGDLGFLKDLRWGASFKNLGMPFTSPGTVGLSGQAPGTAYDSPFTPAVGASATLLKAEKAGIRLGTSVDLEFPSFQNLIFGLGLETSWRDRAFLRLGWDLNLRESLAGKAQSLIPSVGIGASFNIDRGSELPPEERRPWDRSELRPSIAAQKLYGDVWAMGLGVTMPIGVIDREAPLISVRYPETAFDAYYFSPNNDGVLDEVVLPLTISDRRYVQSFELRVYDEAGTLVRSIANKESRPESEDFAGFLKRLAYVKKGVPVPPELVWNGIGDSGELAPDGAYTIVIEASDDNGNRARTEPWRVVIDTRAPEASVAAPAAGLIFSPDGDGNKDTLMIAQSGSAEDLWTAGVYDAAGALLRSWETKGSTPASFAWDGKDAEGKVVPDGVYQYRLASVDRAGNRGSARLDNIIVNTQQPPVSVSIDQAAFSPNGDGVKDILTLTPNVPVRTGMVSWAMAVVDSAGAERWRREGQAGASLEARYAFDGRGADGRALPEGEYRVRLVVAYVNGHRPTVWSPPFVIDLTPPEASASVEREAFNPLGEADTTLLIRQSGSLEDRWLGEIVDERGRPVKSWTFIGRPDAELRWDGSDDAGRVVPDGAYRYRLSAADRAGNSGSAETRVVQIDTQKKAVRLGLERRAFSPNGDGVMDSLGLLPELQTASPVRSWSLSVVPAEGGAVTRRFQGTGAPPSRVVWDGKADGGAQARDGAYRAELEVVFTTNERESARSVEILLDTVAPSAELSAEYLVFSPNGDGRKDTLPIRQSSAPGDDWTGAILDSAGRTVREFAWRASLENLSWDGRDAQGNVAPDGLYRYVLRSEDAAGNRFERSLQGIRVDNRPVQAFVTASAAGFSPNGDGVADTISFSLIVNPRDGVESWTLAMVDSGGAARRTLRGSGATAIPAEFAWDGKGDDGAVTQGEYAAVLTVNYQKGDRVEARSAAFALDSEGPRVSLRLSPEFFSPDNDGVDDELRIALSVVDASAIDSWRFEVFEVAVQESAAAARRERLFFSWSGRGRPAERLSWDGRSQRGELVEAATDYPYRFTISDVWGNVSVVEGVIKVDVLVVRDGDRLKIKVPSIVFRANFADFRDLAPDVVARNEEVLKRIATILNRFRDYRIRVEGHANSISKMTGASAAAIEREEANELLPLSTQRAQAVMNKLIEFGVDARRLSARGLGSSEPVVPFTDADNRWKNRRVEFILIKE